MSKQVNSPDEPLSMVTMLAYLENRLDEAETARVEQLVRQEPFYAEALQQMDLALSENPSLATRAEAFDTAFVAESHRRAQSPAQDQTSAGKHTWLYSLAAAIALFLLAYTVWPSKASVSSLEGKYLAAYTIPGEVRKGGGDAEVANSQIKEKLDQAMSFYLQKEYADALPAFDFVLSQSRDSLSQSDFLRASMGKAVSHVLLGQNEAAQNAFQDIMDEGNNMFVYPSKWYLAWLALKDQRIEDARTGFTEIASRPGPYKEKAAEVLEAIAD